MVLSKKERSPKTCKLVGQGIWQTSVDERFYVWDAGTLPILHLKYLYWTFCVVEGKGYNYTHVFFNRSSYFPARIFRDKIMLNSVKIRWWCLQCAFKTFINISVRIVKRGIPHTSKKIMVFKNVLKNKNRNLGDITRFFLLLLPATKQ